MPVNDDPAGAVSVPTPITEPPASSPAPQGGSDSHPGGDVEASGPEPDEPQGFDPSVQDDFTGIFAIGDLHSEFEWMGHHFAIRTLRSDEVLAVGVVVKGYEGTLGYQKAYQMAMVAACIERVDGQALPVPIGEIDGARSNVHLLITDRFNYLARKWYGYTFDEVFSRYLELEGRVVEIIEQMGKASGQTA